MSDLPTELLVLAWSTALLVAAILLQGQLATRELGLDWNAGPRDGDRHPRGALAGRAQRALDNLKETYPAFVALALALAVSGRTGGLGAAGALLWIAARVVYHPLYLLGVPYLRSLAWVASMVGLLLMFVRLV
ncbi:MAPEG family protein [Sphingomonas silueang]|uniref:MAPEG family protein n=1 Tax=Sphingomonas silueang TaxID=3156617 RepID=UPI0032B4E500